MNGKFETTDDIPLEKFKGIYTKIAIEDFQKLQSSKAKGGFHEDKNPTHLKGIYNAMKSLIRQEKYDFDVSLDMKEARIWIKKKEGARK